MDELIVKSGHSRPYRKLRFKFFTHTYQSHSSQPNLEPSPPQFIAKYICLYVSNKPPRSSSNQTKSSPLESKTLPTERTRINPPPTPFFHTFYTPHFISHTAQDQTPTDQPRQSVESIISPPSLTNTLHFKSSPIHTKRFLLSPPSKLLSF